MAKSELVARMIARYPNLKARDVEAAVTTVIGEMGAVLAKSWRVGLRRICAPWLKSRGSRAARNPRTGASIMVPAKKLVRLNIGRALHNWLNP
jgi:integration host factor subunit beta